MIKDDIRIKLIAGKGGDGGVKFGGAGKKFPSGGFGGNGGDIYVIGTTDLFDTIDDVRVQPSTSTDNLTMSNGQINWSIYDLITVETTP